MRFPSGVLLGRKSRHTAREVQPQRGGLLPVPVGSGERNGRRGQLRPGRTEGAAEAGSDGGQLMPGRTEGAADAGSDGGGS